MLHRCAIAILILLLPSAAFAEPRACRQPRGKIVGGEAARLEHWPGQAAIRVATAGDATAAYFCGGTAIARRWVLTAAHCLTSYMTGPVGKLKAADGVTREARLEVVLGSADLDKVKAEAIHPVSRVIMHERYREAAETALAIADATAREEALEALPRTAAHDLALLELARDWTGPIARLSLAAATDPPDEAGIQVRVAGFGRTERNKDLAQLPFQRRSDGKGELRAGSSTLLETAVETVARDACRQRLGASVISDAQLCAGLELGGRDSCYGDSGGPLVVEDGNGCPRQIGIVSWAMEGCAEARDYAVYTRVSQYAGWIEAHTGPLERAPADDAMPAAHRLSVAQLGDALRHLETVLGPARGRVRIGIGGGNRVRVGGRIRFEAASDTAGRLVLLDIDSSRNVTPLYPNRHVPAGAMSRIAAGARVEIPGPGFPGLQYFEASEPAGKGVLIAIVVPDDFDVGRYIVTPQQLAKGLAPVPEPPSYLMRFIRQIELAIEARSRTGADADELRRWAYAVAEYEIVR